LAVDRRRRRSHRSNRRSHRNAEPALGRRSHGRRSLRVSETAARVRLVCPRVSGASVAPRYRQPEPAHERRALFARDLSVLHDRRGSAALPARRRGRTAGDQRRDPDRPLCVLGALGLRRLTRAILDVVSGDALDRFIAARRERFTEELRELCAIPCEASDHTALDAAARWCRDRLAAAGFADARELRAGGAPALVVGETGSGKRVLVGVQHYDVQPAVPLDLWKTPPYQPALRDGAMYARGVDDNKGHLLLRIQATDADRAMLERMPFDARATRAVVGIEAFAFGRTDDEAKWASVFEPTCNVCGIESGYNGPGSKTVIPAEATGKIDFRLVPDQDPMKIAALLRAHLDRHGFGDVEFSAEEGEHPYRGPADAPLVRAVAAVAEEAFGTPAVLVPSSGGTSPMWVVCNPRRMANVTLGMGHPGAGAHAPNEHILLENYWRALRATARLYSEFATAR